MSLDVYLESEPRRVQCRCPECDLEHYRMESPCFFDRNITHNLNRMAEAAGIYMYLWRPDEILITTAAQLIEPLAAGLEKLRADPEGFRQYNPPNGWGSYEGLVDFVATYLAACRENPTAAVRVSR